MIDPAGDGTLSDKTQKIRGRSRGFAVDANERIVAAQIGDLRPRVLERRVKHLPAACVDGHPRAFEAHVAVQVGERRPAVGVVEGYSLRLDRDEELSLLAIRKRKIGEIAHEPQSRVARCSADERPAQPLTRRARHDHGDVAIDVAYIGFGELDAQVNRPGTLRRSAVGAARIARNLSVGKREPFERDRDTLALAVPADATLQGVEREAFGEYTRQVDGHSAARKLLRTALIRCLEAAGETADSRQAFLRHQSKAGNIAPA